MQKYVIIVAGGKGTRFKAELPKQFVKLGGMPILMHSIIAFYNYDATIKIIVVLPGDQFDFWKKLCAKHQFTIEHELVEGGQVRFESVKNGLSKISENGLVAIHDGVRPLIDYNTISNCFQTAETEGNAIPVIPCVDSLRQVQGDDINVYVNRENYRLIQTPQVFQNQIILNAYKHPYNPSFTDDASVLETLLPGCIKLVNGNRKNIKITNREDLIYAEAIYAQLV